MASKEVVGIVEEISVKGRKEISTRAVFDTGARMTSVDVRLASKAELGPIVKTTKVSNPSLKTSVRRPVVEARVTVMGKPFKILVNIQDREHMSFPVIIGRDVIQGNFMVDPSRNIEMHVKAMREKENDR